MREKRRDLTFFGLRVGIVGKFSPDHVFKLVKRQMYGRGKIDLLQARLIGLTP